MEIKWRKMCNDSSRLQMYAAWWDMDGNPLDSSLHEADTLYATITKVRDRRYYTASVFICRYHAEEMWDEESKDYTHYDTETLIFERVPLLKDAKSVSQECVDNYFKRGNDNENV